MRESERERHGLVGLARRGRGGCHHRGFLVHGLGVQGSRCAVWGLGYGLKGLGVGVESLGLRVWGLGFGVWVMGCRV